MVMSERQMACVTYILLLTRVYLPRRHNELSENLAN